MRSLDAGKRVLRVMIEQLKLLHWAGLPLLRWSKGRVAAEGRPHARPRALQSPYSILSVYWPVRRVYEPGPVRYYCRSVGAPLATRGKTGGRAGGRTGGEVLARTRLL